MFSSYQRSNKCPSLTKTRVKGLTAQSDLVEYDTCIDLEIS